MVGAYKVNLIVSFIYMIFIRILFIQFETDNLRLKLKRNENRPVLHDIPFNYLRRSIQDWRWRGTIRKKRNSRIFQCEMLIANVRSLACSGRGWKYVRIYIRTFRIVSYNELVLDLWTIQGISSNAQIELLVLCRWVCFDREENNLSIAKPVINPRVGGGRGKGAGRARVRRSGRRGGEGRGRGRETALAGAQIHLISVSLLSHNEDTWNALPFMISHMQKQSMQWRVRARAPRLSD